MSTELVSRSEVRGQFPIEDRRYKVTRLVCWSVCVLFALLDAWTGQHYTDPDGISYLNMSDWLLKHNWHLLINAHWSPLYPLLIGVATWLAHPSAYWELPLVHAVNFVILIATLVSFDFLLREVIRVLRKNNEDASSNSVEPAPAWKWQLLGYGLFAWSTFVLVNGVRKVTPDLCVAAFLYLDAALLLRLRIEAKRYQTGVLLGLALGFGYFAKAILFPMAFVFLAVAFFVVGGRRSKLLPLSLTLLIFLAIAAPLFVQISTRVGRPSFSESGSLNIAWQINGEQMIPFHSSDPRTHLRHPMSLLYSHPDVFAFGAPAASTYPPWQDPWYWNVGADTTFNPQSQLREIRRDLTTFLADPYLAPVWVMIFGYCVLLLMSPGIPHRFRYVLKSWPLLVPGIAGLASYTLVLVEPRYIGPFVVLVILGFFPYILVRKSAQPGRKHDIATVAVGGFMLMVAAGMVALHLIAPIPILRGHGGLHYQVAQSLDHDGLQPGQSVAIIGSGWDAMVWARLARVHIVAQISPQDSNDFWRISDPRAKQEVYDAFAKSGARAVVTEEQVPSTGFSDWQRVGDTPYYVHFLPDTTPNSVGKNTL